MFEFLSTDVLTTLFEIVLINLMLSGDNAIVIGLAAAGLPQAQQGKAILIGIVAATILRILFAGLARQILLIPATRGRDSVVVGLLENVAGVARVLGRGHRSEGGYWSSRRNIWRRQAPQNTRPSELADYRG